MHGRNTSAGVKRELCGKQKPVDIQWEDESLSTGIFLFTGYLLFQSPKDSFFEYQLMFWSTFASPVNVCSNQTSAPEWGGSRGGSCQLSFWNLWKEWRHEKDEDMVQPHRARTALWWTHRVRDDCLNRWQMAKQRHLNSESLCSLEPQRCTTEAAVVWLSRPLQSKVWLLAWLHQIPLHASVCSWSLRDHDSHCPSWKNANSKALYTPCGVSFPLPSSHSSSRARITHPVWFGWERFC